MVLKTGPMLTSLLLKYALWHSRQKLFNKTRCYEITSALTVSNQPLQLQIKTFKVHFLICSLKHVLQRKGGAFNVWKAAGIHVSNGKNSNLPSHAGSVGCHTSSSLLWGLQVPALHVSKGLRSTTARPTCCGVKSLSPPVICSLRIVFRNPFRRRPCNPAFLLCSLSHCQSLFYPWPLIGRLSIFSMHLIHLIKLHHIKHRPEIKSQLSKECCRYSFFWFTISCFGFFLSLYRR